jgi:hypothetical protein
MRPIPKISCLAQPSRTRAAACLLLTYIAAASSGAVMNKRNAEDCLKRAAECGRQAEAARDPELKLYLLKLALSWTQAAASEMTERQFEDASDIPARSQS